MYDETSQGTEVDGLWFTSLPSSSKGVLYFDYDGRDEYEVEKRESFTRRDLDDLAFVPDEDYDGFVTIGFSGESDQGEDFSGTLYIEVNGTGRSSSDGEVTYEVDVNAAVDLDHSSGISSLRNIRGQGIPLNIYKHISDYYNSHRNSPLSMSFISDLYPVGSFGI